MLLAYRLETIICLGIFGPNVQTRHLVDLQEKGLMKRGNLLLNGLFAQSLPCIRQLASNHWEAKAFYGFVDNDKPGEENRIPHMASNCQSSVEDSPVRCIQDRREMKGCNQGNQLKKDHSIGLTDGSALGVDPRLVIHAQSWLPSGFSHLKVGNPALEACPPI